jgi:hypothetical protein
MAFSAAEYYTHQFYTWECRGRGWLLSDELIQLEPPYIPFFHFPPRQRFTDDGKRHTLISKAIELIQGKKTPAAVDSLSLDYESIEPFLLVEKRTPRALQIKLPKERKIRPENMKAFLGMLSHIDSMISFEIIGTATEIVIQFVCDARHLGIVETYLIACFPYCSVFRSDAQIDFIDREKVFVVDFGLKHEFVRPLQMPKNFAIDPLTGIIAILERLQQGEQAGMQIVFQPAINPWAESIIRSVTMQDGSSFFIDDPSAPDLALQKLQSPLYGVTIRTFGQGASKQQSQHLLEQISYAVINGSKSPFNELMPLSSSMYDFDTRVDDMLLRTSHRLGMLLNADELVSLLHFPSEHIVSKKLYAASRKTKEVPAIARNKEFIIGENNHEGLTTPVTFGVEERVKHTHILGATGTGKSTLIASLLLQDARRGHSAVLFDPHGDLVDTVIAALPANRLQDVVLIDPSDAEYPIGLNILQAHTDVEKEVLSSDLVASFRKYATSWGDQMNAVLGNAILAILEHPQGGSLHDLRRFLIEKEYRTAFLKNIQDPAILYYWQREYPLLKTNSIGPILTRLDAFLRPKSIRNMVIQKKGIDFETLLNSNKIILCKLSQGMIGMENSFVLGSLFLSKIHQAILRRQQQNQRNPVFIYLDEFQHFITPSIKDMITGIRKYNVGLTLSHQDLQQLQKEDTEVLHSVLGNINTRVVFRVGEPDAKRLETNFSGFDASDLQNLGRGEAIMRIEQPQYDCSLETIPLPSNSIEEKIRNIKTVVSYCRERYAIPKQDVEAMLAATLGTDAIQEHSIKPKQRQEEKPIETVSIPTPVPAESIPDNPEETKDISTHRYLQTLVKKMAEARGYTAGIEIQLPGGGGQVDVLLSKEGKTTAVEICNTTEPEWEMHNIAKCLAAGYNTVISLSGDIKQLEKIKKKCMAELTDFKTANVEFFTPDALFSYLDATANKNVSQEKVMKGYRINVSYDAITNEEMDRKRASVAQVVLNTLKKMKK